MPRVFPRPPVVTQRRKEAKVSVSHPRVLASSYPRALASSRPHILLCAFALKQTRLPRRCPPPLTPPSTGGDVPCCRFTSSRPRVLASSPLRILLCVSAPLRLCVTTRGAAAGCHLTGAGSRVPLLRPYSDAPVTCHLSPIPSTAVNILAPDPARLSLRSKIRCRDHKHPVMRLGCGQEVYPVVIDHNRMSPF